MSTQQELSYALAKQVPDMARGFTIQTNYGELQIAADEAAPFMRAASKLLEKKIGRAEKHVD